MVLLLVVQEAPWEFQEDQEVLILLHLAVLLVLDLLIHSVAQEVLVLILMVAQEVLVLILMVAQEVLALTRLVAQEVLALTRLVDLLIQLWEEVIKWGLQIHLVVLYLMRFIMILEEVL